MVFDLIKTFKINYIFIFIVTYFIIRIFYAPLKRVAKWIFKIGINSLILIAANYCCQFSGLRSVGVNLITILIASVLGPAGVVSMLTYRNFFC